MIWAGRDQAGLGPHLDLSRATIMRLANSMEQREPLRKIFLSAPAVARVLG